MGDIGYIVGYLVFGIFCIGILIGYCAGKGGSHDRKHK